MIAITNGKVVTVTDKTYEKGTVLIEDGKIKAVGERIEIPHDAQVIDAAGCWVMPGLIDSTPTFPTLTSRAPTPPSRWTATR